MLVIDAALPLPEPQTEYEAQALHFCQQWLSGQSHFQLQTSGSTGTPKVITLTRAQMQASARLTAETFQLQPGDRALCCLNVHYIAGVMMLVRTLECGLRTFLTEPSSDPLPTAVPLDFAAFVPLQLQHLLEKPSASVPQLNQMKAIIIGGAAVSQALHTALQIIQAPVYATYGMTETVSHIAIRRLNGTEQSDYFQALPGVVLGLDDRDCLHITAAASNFERIQTNDVVEMQDGGRFRILGRADHIINSGGIKIQLEEVERWVEPILQDYYPGKRFFAWGFPDERLGQALTLVIEAESLAPEQNQELLQQLKNQLPAYKSPRSLRTVQAFQHTPTEKVDKRATVQGLPTE
ncbi:AMP-binding protein [Siphonobacter sp.]|uniref:AMP-binding protein n=1 Tax=Siphonobacter sp. TaxID=1869184 RepID=UPI003B3A2A8D